MDEQALILLGTMYSHYDVNAFVRVVGYVMSSVKRLEHVSPGLMMNEELRPYALAEAAGRKFPDYIPEAMSGIKHKVDQMGMKNPSLITVIYG